MSGATGTPVVIDFERSSSKVPYVLPPGTRQRQIDARRDAGAGAEGIDFDRSRRSAWPDACAGAAGFGATWCGIARSDRVVLALSAASCQTQPPVPAQPEIWDVPRRRVASSPDIRSASISRARTCARCCARSRRSAASTSSIDPAVQGTVDVALRDVPWDQALDIILAANKLGYIVDGTIVRIAPAERARRRKKSQRRKLNETSRRSPASCGS